MSSNKKDYFTMVVTVGGNIKWSGSTTANTLSYSKNNGSTWTTANSSTTISVTAGDRVLWKGTPTPQSSKGIGRFSGATNVRYSVEGNAMSLLFGDNFKGQTSLSGKNYALYNLFNGNTNVTSAENLSLPATTLANNCYRGMFYSGTSLTTAPELQATTLASDCYRTMFAYCTSLTTTPQLLATTLATSCYHYMFVGCTSLTSAPQLPVTTLASSCYYGMFSGCTSITTAPQLPATTLADSCYCEMFDGCTSLTTAPELPATTLADSCYSYMFGSCRNLTTAPELPATTLADSCYSFMFRGCTSLTTAPELPATTLTHGCYSYMFDGCTSLTTAPELPATTLAIACYQIMFRGCTSLTTAPELPATTLVSYCYDYMFRNCTNLNSIKCLATDISASDCTYNWVSGVASSGTFTKDASMRSWTTGVNGIPTNWNVVPLDYLTTVALEDGTISFNIWKSMGTDMITSISYSKNNGTTWTTTNNVNNKAGHLTITVNVSEGDKVLWKGDAQQLGYYDEDDYGDYVGSFFSSDCEFNVQGNVMSMLYGDDFVGEDTLNYEGEFAYLFHDYDGEYECSVVSAEHMVLPATTLTSFCYQSMFQGCTSLTTAPQLLATTLTDYCYSNMFQGCTNLTTAPQLPATTLANDCYNHMFYNCTSLTTAPQLLATTLAIWCYESMFQGCTSLTEAPELPATTLADSCYYYMFRDCSSLTTAPQLPATTLARQCYSRMFQGCTSLTTAPELPATTLEYYCYYGMFSGCTSLNSIKCLATDISASHCTTDWVKNVASSGTFTKDASMRSWTIGVNGIPTNWSVVPLDYLTTVALEDGTISFNIWKSMGTNMITSISYSTDNGETWTTTNNVNNKVEHLPISVNVSEGDNVLWKGNARQLGYYDEDNSDSLGSFFSSDCEFNVQGNVMSMLYGDDFVGEDTLNYEGEFACLFSDYDGEYECSVVSAEHMVLPATALTESCYRYMFYNRPSLTTAPSVLPATTLAGDCCFMMFEGCTSLTSAPELPATTLASFCYYGMFEGCTSLTTAPSVLPATTLTNNCYQYMFNGCTSLTTAPELLVTTLADNCCESMFQGCTSLTTAPSVLPATTLANNCYQYMFSDCTRLTTAPQLPATTLATECYYQMFYGCTSLTTAPELPATTLAERCYYQMFRGCTSLNSIKCLATNISATNCTFNWVSGVASSGTFTKDESMSGWSTGVNGIPNGWNVVSQGYFTMVVTSGGNIKWSGTTTANTLSYSKDNGATWTTANSSTTISVAAGDRVLWKGTPTPQTSYPNFGIGKFSGATNVRYSVEGNAMSLLYGDNFKRRTSLQGKNYALYGLFSDNTNVTSAENLSLPATTLTNSCYNAMFSNCTSLTTALSILPATTLASGCYNSMFYHCTSLTTAPQLPATTLASNCYNQMFQGCTSLTTAPQLLATTLPEWCYFHMFQGCTSLKSIKCLAIDISASHCTDYWVSGVASSGTFTKAASMTSWKTGTSGIPSGWSVKNA